jgi:ethanolamine utilization protein EutN
VNLARVIGTVWCTVKDEHLEGVRFKILVAEDETGRSLGEPFVAADAISSREGDRVFFVRSREAAKAFPGKFAPLDAAILGLVDGTDHDAAAEPPGAASPEDAS